MLKNNELLLSFRIPEFISKTIYRSMGRVLKNHKKYYHILGLGSVRAGIFTTCMSEEREKKSAVKRTWKQIIIIK